MSSPGVCAVVGVGPGLGSAAARRFAAGGYDLGLINRSQEVIQALAAELSSAVRTVAVVADAAQDTDGLTEAGHDVDAGEARLACVLAEVVASFSPAETLRRGVLGNGESIEPHDDVAILTVQLTPARHRRLTDLGGIRTGNFVRRV